VALRPANCRGPGTLQQQRSTIQFKSEPGTQTTFRQPSKLISIVLLLFLRNDSISFWLEGLENKQFKLRPDARVQAFA
jgi:hypothetical protein